MTRDDLLKFHAEACARMAKICAAKNSDYAGQGGASPFANFTRVEALGIATTETGFLTRMVDKIARVTSLFASGGKGEVKDESEEDTLLDLANYCILLAAYRRERHNAAYDAQLGQKLSRQGLMDEDAIRRACEKRGDNPAEGWKRRTTAHLDGDRCPELDKDTGLPAGRPWNDPFFVGKRS